MGTQEPPEGLIFGVLGGRLAVEFDHHTGDITHGFCLVSRSTLVNISRIEHCFTSIFVLNFQLSGLNDSQMMRLSTVGSDHGCNAFLPNPTGLYSQSGDLCRTNGDGFHNRLIGFSNIITGRKIDFVDS